MKTLIRLFYFYSVILLMASCTAFSTKTRTGELSVLVQSVQVAVQEAAKDDVWKQLSTPYKEWAKECETLTDKKDITQLLMLKDAGILSDKFCKNSKCDDYYGMLSEGKTLSQFLDPASNDKKKCKTGLDKEEENWCNSALTYNLDQEAENSTCALMKSLSIPALKKASISVLVKDESTNGAAVNLLVVSAGGNLKTEKSHAMTVELSPIAGDPAKIYSDLYGGKPLPKPMRPEPIDPTKFNAAQTKLKNDIKGAILSAVKTSQSFQDKTFISQEAVSSDLRNLVWDNNKVKKDNLINPIMTPSSYKIELQVILTEEGSFKIGQNLPEGSGFSFGTSKSKSKTNTITIEYSI